MFHWAVTGLALGLALTLTTASRADEFVALPGLWKTQISEPGEKPVTRWHCVVEGADPWVGYAQLPSAKDASCKRQDVEYTSHSLAWTVSCPAGGPATIAGGAPQLIHQGRIVFDAPDHYVGHVDISGSQLGYPIHQRITIEGRHRAACTSPSD